MKSYKNKYIKKLIKLFINGIKNFSDVDKLILELISLLKKIRNNVNNLIWFLKVGMQLGQYNELYDEGFRRCPHWGTMWSTYCGSPFIICGKREV